MRYGAEPFRSARLSTGPSPATTAPRPRRCWPGSAGSPTSAPRPSATRASRGDLDHFGALSFLQGLLVILRDSGFSGLVVVLDEVETLQRVRSDVREKSLNALRHVIDEIDSGRFPGLYLVITGTPAFFEGPRGVQPAAAPRPAARRGLLRRAPVRQSARPAGAAAQLRPAAAPGCRAEDSRSLCRGQLPLRRMFWSARMTHT